MTKVEPLHYIAVHGGLRAHMTITPDTPVAAAGIGWEPLPSGNVIYYRVSEAVAAEFDADDDLEHEDDDDLDEDDEL